MNIDSQTLQYDHLFSVFLVKENNITKDWTKYNCLLIEKKNLDIINPF